tara:strand:- start:500 stop:1933 length:1434 start_codon:yes stop_codon:yes gene_type:complete
MGNKQSITKRELNKDLSLKNKKFKLPNTLHYIAARYITKLNFKDMENLHKPEYCNKMILLTSKVLQKHLTMMEVEYLDLSVRGSNPDEFKENKKKDVIAFLAKENLEDMNVSSKRRKQRMCTGIAKFYIKVAHIYAAINKACNPHLEYIDYAGNKQSVPVMKKHTIPKGVKSTLTKMNFCTKRINALKPVQNTDNRIVVKGKNCNMNKKMMPIVGGANEPVQMSYEQNRDPRNFPQDPIGQEPTGWSVPDRTTIETPVEVPQEFEDTMNLFDETGIPELEKLYYDIFDFKTGEFYGMSEKSKNQYFKDLTTFYTTLNKTKKLPPSIKRFSDIKLKDFHNQQLCKTSDSPWKKSYTAKASNKLFKSYAKHVAEMIKNNQENEKHLLNIIEQLFSFWIDPKTREKKITLNPKLNYKRLEKLIPPTREKLIKLYIDCEKDFQKGLNILEAIVKDRLIKAARLKIENFESTVDKLTDSIKS